MNAIELAKRSALHYDSLPEFQEKDSVNANILALHGIEPGFLTSTMLNGDKKWYINEYN